MGWGPGGGEPSAYPSRGPSVLHPQRPATRRRRGLAAAATTGLLASGLALAGPAAQAAEPLPRPWSASTSGQVLDVGALDLTLLGAPSLLGLGVGEVTGRVTSTGTPRSSATATNLELGLAGQGAPVPGGAQQTAPADNPQAAVGDAPPTSVPGVLDLGLAATRAHARWPGDTTCLPATTPVSSSSVTSTGVEVAPALIPLLGPLGLPLPGVSQEVLSLGSGTVSQSVQLVATGGADDARAVQAQVVGSGVSLELLGAIDVQLSSPATLTARADGVTAGRVDYDPATISVTVAGQTAPIPTDGSEQSFALPSNPLLGVSLAAGTPTGVVQSATTASASVATLSVEVTAAGGLVTILSADVLPLSASATAPTGGIACADPTLDEDLDGLTSAEEKTAGTDPEKADTDLDGLKDGLEVKTHRTDPLKNDTDGDTLLDGAEVQRGTNPLLKDTDADGLEDAAELVRRTNPLVADTDGDGLEDGAEVAAGSDPLDARSPGTTDPTDPATPTPGARDRDRDGLSDAKEHRLGTDPRRADTDRDGLEDGVEVTRWRTNPKKKDTDRDGMSDGREVRLGRNPLKRGR